MCECRVLEVAIVETLFYILLEDGLLDEFRSMGDVMAQMKDNAMDCIHDDGSLFNLNVSKSIPAKK